LRFTLLISEVKGPHEIDRAFTTIRKGRPGALLLIPDPSWFVGNQSRIAELTLKRRLPAIGTVREWADAGGLMSYGTSFHDLWRRAATYVDKILKGAKPADLPVEQPMRFQFVINMKTAKVLGLTFPQSILIRADQVIE
jgi:putative ABC transport system substrate-binding protein